MALSDNQTRLWLLELKSHVLDMVAHEQDLEEVLRQLNSAMEQATGSSRCTISIADPESPTAVKALPPHHHAHQFTDADGTVIGTANLEFGPHQQPTERDNEVLDTIGHLFKVAVETENKRRTYEQTTLCFESLAATIPGVVYQRRVSPDGDINYTYISDGARELFGVSPEEILADPKSLFACYSLEYSSTLRERLLKASQELSLWDVEVEITSRDGAKKFTHAIARPEREEDGSVLWSGIILDATRMKKVELALRDAKTRFEALTATIPGVVYQRRVTPDGKINYTYISDGAQDLFGVSAEEILSDSQALFACHGPEYRATFRERLLKASRELTLWDVEAKIVTRDGQSKLTHAIARPHLQKDGSVLWNGIILDATRMQKAKQKLRVAKEAAEAANNAKSDFLANMSHELRTPLNAVIGFSEVMMNEILGPLGHDNYKGYVKDINESGSLLLCLVNDILDLSKVAAGESTIHDDAVNLPSLLKLCTNIVSENVREADLTLDLRNISSLPRLRADETKLKQILLNLLSNAIKFTPSGGQIIVQGGRTNDGGVDISVIDNGIGIDPERIPDVMRPFKQVECGMSRKYSGTGLGLPLVKALVELHSGQFVLTSQEGVGTTATISLPADRILDNAAERTLADESTAASPRKRQANETC